MATAPKVHVHASAPAAFLVNSFLVEGERSVVLIDTQFVLSEARAVLRKLADLKKPLAAAFVTHPHPDHYNGLATILSAHPGVTVHATAATIQGIKETAEPKRAYWTPIVGADYPQAFAIPDVEVVDGQRLGIDGIELVVRDFGAAESSDNTAIELPQIDAVVVSDLVYNRVHPWLAEGRSERWLAALQRAKVEFGAAATIYAGHGAAGQASAIDEQADYIRTLRDWVAKALSADGTLSPAARAVVQQKIQETFAGYPLDMIVPMNIDGLAAELAPR